MSRKINKVKHTCGVEELVLGRMLTLPERDWNEENDCAVAAELDGMMPTTFCCTCTTPARKENVPRCQTKLSGYKLAKDSTNFKNILPKFLEF